MRTKMFSFIQTLLNEGLTYAYIAKTCNVSEESLHDTNRDIRWQTYSAIMSKRKDLLFDAKWGFGTKETNFTEAMEKRRNKSTSQQKVIQYLKKHPTASLRKAAKEIGVSHVTAQRAVKNLSPAQRKQIFK